MTAWVLSAAALALLVAVAALALEHALRLFGRPARGVWAAALAASLVLPFARSPRGSEPSPPAGVFPADAFPVSASPTGEATATRIPSPECCAKRATWAPTGASCWTWAAAAPGWCSPRPPSRSRAQPWNGGSA